MIASSVHSSFAIILFRKRAGSALFLSKFIAKLEWVALSLCYKTWVGSILNRKAAIFSSHEACKSCEVHFVRIYRGMRVIEIPNDPMH